MDLQHTTQVVGRWTAAIKMVIPHLILRICHVLPVAPRHSLLNVRYSEASVFRTANG